MSLGSGLRVTAEQAAAWGPRFASENDYAFQKPSYALLDDGQQARLPRIEATPETTRVARDWDPNNEWDNARGPVPTDVPLAGVGDEFMRGWRDPRGMQRSVMDAPVTAAETAGRYSSALADSFKNFGMSITGARSMNEAQASWKAGNYGTSLLQGGTAFAEAGMTVLSAGTLSTARYGATLTAAELAAVRETYMPSAFARSLQGAGNYPGVDRFRDVTLKEGTIIFGGAPGQSNFYTTASALERSGGNAGNLFSGLQVSPNPIHGYRPGVTAYEVVSDTRVAFGRTLTNPQHGAGGLPQIVIEDYQNVLRPIYLVPLK